MILYKESQRFTQIWLWLIFLISNSISIYAVINQVIFNKIIGNNPSSDLVLIIICVTYLIFTLLFFSLKLETQIKQDGIYYRFFPFQIKMRKIEWHEIEKAYVREYKPLSEYGGWGIRGFKSDRAYNIKGKTGLQLELKNGNKVLFGTQKGKEIEEVIKTYFN